MKLKDRVAIVTGAASGIGAATARLFAAEGARVALVDLDEKGVRDVASEIEVEGGQALAIAADVSRADHVRGGDPLRIQDRAGIVRELFERGYQMVAGPHDLALLRDAARLAVQDYAGFRDGTDSAGQAPPAPSRSY